MAEVATAEVGLVPNATGFGSRLSGAIGGQLTTAGRDGGLRFAAGMRASLSGAAKSIFGPLAVAAGALAVGDFLGNSIGEARESQKVGAITTQIIKSTGGAAKVSAEQVGTLAEAISNKTGVDDEAIQTGSNLLLTFKQVRNEVGKGNQIFDRATAAAVDLSKAGFGSIESTSKQLGKALQDPVKGLTALGRAGVTFTADQQKQIKAMVKAGDVLGAQKIILAEVESQVGGVAAASATAGEKFSTTWANFQETVGTVLLPVLDAGLTKLSGFVQFLGSNLGPAVSKVSGFLEPVVGAIQGFFSSAGDGPSKLAPLVQFIQTQVIPRFQGIVDAVRGFVSVALPIVQQFIAGMRARIAPLLPTIQSIFGTIGGIVTGAMDGIKATIERVTAIISFIWTNWGQGIMNLLSAVWSGVLGIIRPALETIRSIIATFTAVMRGDWSAAWEGVKGIIAGVWGVIKGIVTGALGVIKQLLSAAWGAIKQGVSAAWNGIVSFFGTAMTRIGTAVNTGITNVVRWFAELPGKILAAIAGLGKTLYDAGSNVIGGFIQGLISRAQDIVNAVRDKVIGILPDFVKDFFDIRSPSHVMMKLGAQTAAGMAVGLESGARDVQRAADSLIPSMSASRYSVSVGASGSAAGPYGPRLHPADLAALARAVSGGPAPEIGVDMLNGAMMGRRP